MGSSLGGGTLDEVAHEALPDDLDPDALVPVEHVTRELRGLFKAYTKFDDEYVVGEVTDLSEHASNRYFELRAAHEHAGLNCVIWGSKWAELDADLESDMLVAVRGTLSFFEGGGRPTLEVTDLNPVGESAYWRRIAVLRSQFEREGLFDEDRKAALPPFPSTVGIVTAALSDAEQDLVETIHTRYPDVDVLIQNSTVQGERAPEELAHAIETVDQSVADVIVVSRGGGSETALRPFNDETVVRAVANADTPVVAAIGHDADEPLVDAVADERAKTPTAAGELVVPEKREYLQWVEDVTAETSDRFSRQATRWVADHRDATRTAYSRLASRWIDQHRTVVGGSYANQVDPWLHGQRETIEIEYENHRTNWLAEHRLAVSQAFQRIEREHQFEQQRVGLEKGMTVRNAVIVGLVIFILLLLLI